MNLYEIQIRTEFLTEIEQNYLFKKTRIRKYVWARFYFYKLCKEEFEFTLQKITDFSGRKNHTSIMYGINRISYVDGELEKYNAFKYEFLNPKKSIGYYENSIKKILGTKFLTEYKLLKYNQ